MPEIDVRPVVIEDIESLSALEHGYYSEFVWQMALELNSDSTRTDFRRTRLPRQFFVPYPRERAQIFKDLSQPEAFLAAVLDGNAVGYIKLQTEGNSKIVRVSDLVISAPLRRKGIASGLILAALDLISHRRFIALVLEMQSKNDPAIVMAEKLGFKFCGYQDHYFPNNDLALFFSRFIH